MMSDFVRWETIGQPPPEDREEVIDALTDRVRQLEDRVRWIEAQVAVDRARRERKPDYG